MWGKFILIPLVYIPPKIRITEKRPIIEIYGASVQLFLKWKGYKK